MPKINKAAAVAAKPSTVKAATDEILAAEQPVIAKRSKAGVKKPTATASTPATGSLNDAIAELAEWAEYAGDQGASDRRDRKRAANIRPLAECAVGELVNVGGRTATVLQNNAPASVRVLTQGNERQEWAPTAEVEVLPAGTRGTTTTVTEGKVVVKTVGSKKSHEVEGSTHTKLAMHAGGQGWSVEDVKKIYKHYGLPEISEASIKTFMYSGKKGGADRGGMPTYTAEQQIRLLAAAGKAPPTTPAPKGGKK